MQNAPTSPDTEIKHFRRQSKTVAQLLEHLGSRKGNSADELNNNNSSSPDEKRLVIDTDMLDTETAKSPVIEKKTTSPRTVNKKFSCRLCGKRFVHRQNLFAHENTHTGERPFRCIFCNKGFKCPSTLCKHKRCMHPAEMAKISPERRLGDTSIKHISLAREKRSINKDGCFEYPLARVPEMSPSPGNENDSAHLNVLNGLSASYAKNFDHMNDTGNKTKKIKTEENTFPNEGKPFLFSAQNVPISPIDQKPSWLISGSENSQKKAASPDNSLSRRKRSLSPDTDPPMPYQCHVCFKKFANSNSLNQHKYTHATDRSIQCNVCGRMFKHPGAMYRHRRTVHTEPALQRTQSPGSPNDQKMAQQLAQRQLMASLQVQASMQGMALPPSPLGVGGIRLPGIHSPHQAFPADALALRDAYFTSSVAAAHIPQQFYLAQAAMMQAAMARQPQLPATQNPPSPENDETAPPKNEDDVPLNLVKPKESSDHMGSEEPNAGNPFSEGSTAHNETQDESACHTPVIPADTEVEAVTASVRDRRKNTYPRKYLIPKATVLTSDDGEDSCVENNETAPNENDVTFDSPANKNNEVENSPGGLKAGVGSVNGNVTDEKEYDLSSPEKLIIADIESGNSSSGEEAEEKERISTPNSTEVTSSCHPLHVQTQTEQLSGDDDTEFENMLSRWFAKRKLFECPHCKIIFREFSIFAMHFGMHVSSNPLQCSFCGRHCKDKFEFLCHHS